MTNSPDNAQPAPGVESNMAQAAPAATDPAYSEACSLATALFEKHYRKEPDYASGRVVWSLCDTTAGVISQIDNMVSGLVRAPAAGAVAGPWKDHQTREIVNQLRDCAKEFHATQQLRERLLDVLGPMIDWVRAVQAPTPAATADSTDMMTPREAALIVAIQGECNHAARNDMRLNYSMDKARSNVIAVPESMIDAAIEGWKHEHGVRELGPRDELAAQADSQPAPIDMVLHCPSCFLQHIDAPDERTPDWKNEPHRSHLCHGCGHIWRPSDVPTNGVAAVKTTGKADSPIAACAPADSVPKAQFDDPKVQAVYDILCDDTDWPPKENPQQHWEGWIARRIVDALLADSVLEDAALVFTATHIDYVARFGGRCRDCADGSGVCPGSGLPCADSRKAIKHVFDALEYGVKHGYITSPVAARKQGAKHD